MANCHCTTRSSKLPSKLSLPVNKIALLQKSVRLRSMQPAKKKLLASTFLADRERHKKNNFDALTSTRQFPDSKCQELFEKNNSKKKKTGPLDSSGKEGCGGRRWSSTRRSTSAWSRSSPSLVSGPGLASRSLPSTTSSRWARVDFLKKTSRNKTFTFYVNMRYKSFNVKCNIMCQFYPEALKF